MIANLSIFSSLFQMTIKGAVLSLFFVALMVRYVTPIYKACSFTGFHPHQPLLQFKNPEETGLLWIYVLHTPNRFKKVTRAEKLFNTRALIVMLLIIGGIESHPGEFI